MSDVIGWIALAFAALIGVDNFYSSFLRPPLHWLMGRECRWKPGVGLVGTLFLCVAVACLWRIPEVRMAALVIAVIDTGGVPWLLVMILENWLRKDAPPNQNE